MPTARVRSSMLVATSLLTFIALPAPGQAPAAADKRGFTLFNPTPRELMREMSTDRPDTTESAYTVDAGHVQFELSFFDYARNDDAGVRVESLAVLPSNVKVGLLNNVDVQFVFTPYLREDTDA